MTDPPDKHAYVDLDSFTTSLLDARSLLAAVSNSPTELTCLHLVPCVASGLGRVVAPPGVLPSDILSSMLPRAVLLGHPLIISLALSDSYPAHDLDSISAALDAVERRLVVVASLTCSAHPPHEQQRLLLPVSMCPNPGERTLLVSLAVPTVPVFSTSYTVTLEELSMAGETLLPLPQSIRMGVSHDIREAGAVWRAAMAGDVTTLLNALLDGGSTEEAVGDATCLLVAIRMGRLDVVSALVRAGADMNCKLGYYRAPLLAAVTLRKADCVAALLDAPGIDVNVGRERELDTPLHAACSSSMTDACLGLLLASPGIDVEALNGKGETALHVAAAAGANVAVAMLLAAGASPNARALDGETPLHRATTAPCVKSLIAAPGVDVNAATPLGYTPLHRAVSRGAHGLACLLVLLSAPGLNPNPRDSGGATPLYLAALQGQDWAVSALLDAHIGVDLGARNSSGQTPQQVAELRGRASTAALLWRHGARKGKCAVQ